MKRFLYYFGWTVIIGVVIYFGVRYQVWLEEQSRMYFDMLPFVLFTAIFPILIGLLLRLPKLIIEIKQNVPWTFDWVKFVAVGLPALCILSMYILPFIPLGEGFIRIPYIIMIGGPMIQTIAGIVFGYSLLDSLKR
ncbi:hypothetical protein [Lentibacillus sediminis]|uniref:hypothetical protein n=1 Tax=Lentibacillus sediminis TaxID=1940529 RepID=UPI000C1C11E2|nr:hypothetical protein [Lentibacillus sediminis]